LILSESKLSFGNVNWLRFKIRSAI